MRARTPPVKAAARPTGEKRRPPTRFPWTVRGKGWVVLLAALLAPLPFSEASAAGGAEDPELTDPEDQASSPADLLAAWFEGELDGLRFSVRTLDGSMPERYPDHVYWVSFRVDGRRVEASVGFGDDGRMRGHLGPAENGRGGYEAWANGQVEGLRSQRGRPSTWSGLIPWDAVEGLEPGATLTDLRAWTSFYQRRTDTWRATIDLAAAPGPFVAEAPRPLLPILVPHWVIPTIVVAATAVGAAGGGMVAQAHGRRVKALAAAALRLPPQRAPAPPPGKRFRRDPRQGSG